MELRQLRYFVAAAEEAHMSRAAQRLRVSQPAVSQQIRDLEADVGSALFERLPKGLRLTSAGEILLDQARRVLADIEHMHENLRHAGRGEVGRLRIAINEIAGQQRLIAQIFQRFRSAYPNVALDLVQLTAFEQIEALHDGRIDAGFQHNQNQDTEFLDCLILREEHFLLGVPAAHAFATRDDLSVADLADQPLVWLHRSVNPLMSDQLMACLLNKNVTPRIVIEARSDVSMMNFISVGLGLGLVVSGQRWGGSGDIRFKRLADLSLPLNFVFASRKGDPSPLLRNFAEIVAKSHDDHNRQDPD